MSGFVPDSIDPTLVPVYRFPTEATMPKIGLGTFGSDKYSPQQIADAVRDAVRSGYRHVDCAAVYGNEREIGGALRDLAAEGVRRDDLWVTSKLWNDRHAEEDVVPACRQTLANLGLDHLDLYLVHWPFPNYHAPGVDVSARDPHAQPYRHEAFMATWRQMERLVASGLVRHIGTSNMTIPKLRLLLRDAAIRPVVDQMELHPHFQQPELFDYVVSEGILPVGYCPLGSPSRPERDRTPNDTSDMDDPAVLEIADRRGVTPAWVCVRWAIQRGQVPIPFSVKRAQYLDSLRAAIADPLSEGEMAALAAIDRGCRLIKGQVFLWKEGQTWEDLWDPHGEITPP
ncbi:MAG: aldo/keto reductase [Fimbriimonadaceae bacterium]|nr:aldo/keto reductase [Fimbriimonadaceae bacterium]